MAEKDWSDTFGDQFEGPVWYTSPINVIWLPLLGSAVVWLCYAAGIFHTYW